MAPVVLEPYRDETQLEFIMELMKETLSEQYSIFTYRYFLQKWPDLCFLAKDEAAGRYVGCCVGKLSQQKESLQGYLAMISVDKDHRRQGIATQLARRLFDAMIEQHCDKIVVETESTNEAALQFYVGLGFVKEQKMIRYYMNGFDAFQLTLAVTPAGVSKSLSVVVDEDND